MIELSLRLARPGSALAVDLRLETHATGVFGPSGAGKTTLLHAIAGLVRADACRLVVDGETLEDTAAGRRLPPHRRAVAVVFQEHRLFPHLSAAGNLRYGERAGSPPFADVVELLGLGGLLERRPHQLSGGERQRVALGRALLSAPRLLLLDEPLASLDRGLRRQILPYLRAVGRELRTPVIHVSHDLSELATTCDELVLLDRGAVAAQGPLADLARLPAAIPLLHDLGLVSVLPGTVQGHEPDDGLTWIRLAGTGAAVVGVGLADLPAGAACEVLLRPADVALCLGPRPPGLSITNAVPGRVAAVTPTRERTLVTVDIGAARPLLIEVVGRAVGTLGLAAGTAVTCLWKAQAAEVRR